jgi:hypothetical protein
MTDTRTPCLAAQRDTADIAPAIPLRIIASEFEIAE